MVTIERPGKDKESNKKNFYKFAAELLLISTLICKIEIGFLYLPIIE